MGSCFDASTSMMSSSAAVLLLTIVTPSMRKKLHTVIYGYTFQRILAAP